MWVAFSGRSDAEQISNLDILLIAPCRTFKLGQEPVEVTSPEAIVLTAVADDDNEFHAQCKLVRARCNEGPAECAQMIREVRRDLGCTSRPPRRRPTACAAACQA